MSNESITLNPGQAQPFPIDGGTHGVVTVTNESAASTAHFVVFAPESNPELRVSQDLAPSGHWVSHPVSSKAQAIPGLMIYRFTHSMYYANARQLSEEMTALMNTAQPPLRWFCIDASAVPDVDYSAAETLKSLFAALEERGIRLVVAQVLGDVDPADRYKLQELFGKDAFYGTLDDVVQAYQQV